MTNPDGTREFLTEMFGQIGERFDTLESDIGERFDAVDQRFDRLDEKVDQVVRESGALIDAVADINKRLN